MNKNIYAIDLSFEAPRLYAIQLPELIERYLAAVACTCEPRTVGGYRTKLRHVINWWKTFGPQSDWMLGAEELAGLNDYLDTVQVRSGKMLSYSSRTDILGILAQCLRWARGRGYVPIDLSDEVPTARGMRPDRKVVELSVLDKMLSAARRGANSARDLAIVALLAGTGIRCEECAILRVRDVTLHPDNSGYVILRQAKFDKPRTVGIDSATGIQLRPWLDVFHDGDSPIFPSRNGKGRKALSSNGVYKVIVRLAEDAGVREQIRGPHDLRRMFATLWMRRLPGKGYGELLQRQLGHASFATTQRYSLQDVEQVIQVMRQEPASPMAQLAETHLYST